MTPVLPLPKYHQIYLVLREQLEEGRFADGMPGELALMQQFSVARVTVRRALERGAAPARLRRRTGLPWPVPGLMRASPAGRTA